MSDLRSAATARGEELWPFVLDSSAEVRAEAAHNVMLTDQQVDRLLSDAE